VVAAMSVIMGAIIMGCIAAKEEVEQVYKTTGRKKDLMTVHFSKIGRSAVYCHFLNLFFVFMVSLFYEGEYEIEVIEFIFLLWIAGFFLALLVAYLTAFFLSRIKKLPFSLR